MKRSLMYNQIGELESKRNFLIQKLKGLRHEDLHAKPKNDKWSILEIIEHVILSEELSVGYAMKKISNPDKLKPVGIMSAIKVQMMKYVLVFNVKYKAPEITEPKITTVLVFDELMDRWSLTRQGLEKISESSTDILKMGILKHPYIGFMNFRQMILFIDAHYNHHLVQIGTLLDDLKKEIT